MDNEDARLLELFKTNEREAFRELFIRYYKPMVLAAKIYSNNAQEAEDLVQQVFVKVWEEKLYNRINTSFKRYLQVSVRNACFNQIASIRAKPAIERDMSEDMLIGQAIDFMLIREEVQIFEKAFDALPMQSRVVFELVYFEDQPYKTAAQTLNLSLNTIKSHLRNAIRILKNSPVINSYYSDRKKS
ncbi:MAG: sigma-70 family RNA polymerase sigma factor [Bacteroidales bacterium]|nr:sigma-70 family RNA polymerase sigma factor [Bacteroidales bacterium]